MADRIRIQIMFTRTTSKGQYTDCLYYTQAEYASMTEKNVNDAIDNRVANYEATFVNIITPTKAQTLEHSENIRKESEEIRKSVEAAMTSTELQTEIDKRETEIIYLNTLKTSVLAKEG